MRLGLMNIVCGSLQKLKTWGKGLQIHLLNKMGGFYPETKMRMAQMLFPIMLLTLLKEIKIILFLFIIQCS